MSATAVVALPQSQALTSAAYAAEPKDCAFPRPSARASHAPRPSTSDLGWNPREKKFLTESAALGLVGGLVGTRRASRVPPVEALRR